MRRCILVVAMADSVHTVRWLQMINSNEMTVVLLPSTERPSLPEIAALPAVRSQEDVESLPAGQVGVWLGRAPASHNAAYKSLPLPIFWRSGGLVSGSTVCAAVRELRPALVHSMEIQHAGYACLQAAKTLGADFPPWLVSNWGSDLYLYEKLEDHRAVLIELLAHADALHSECHRDAVIAHRLGYDKGRPIHVIPASGGEDLTKLSMPRLLPSARDAIVIKGYHGWSGRATHALSAVLMAAPDLRNFRFRIYFAGEAVAAMAREVARVTALDIQVDSWSEDRQVALQRMATARIAMGIGISDGIGTSFLEAMALGAFPIAATTACACEWVRNGIDGFVVNPHDVGALAEAVTRAASDDALVDAASLRNRRVVEQRWDIHVNREPALRMYRDTMEIVHERPPRSRHHA
jgi:hypothetical protein